MTQSQCMLQWLQQLLLTLNLLLRQLNDLQMWLLLLPLVLTRRLRRSLLPRPLLS